jgi:TorA maturation chaperone TorD
VNPTESSQKQTEAQYRSDIYGLLAALFRREITPDLLKQVKDSQFLGILPGQGAGDLEGFWQGDDDAVIEALAVEYARLFLGPGKHISPHESIHHTRPDGDWGRLWGGSTVEVKKFIESTGLSFAKEYKGLPDHIAAEFELMQALTRQEAQAWGAADSVKAGYFRGIEKQFIGKHLSQWVSGFCTRVAEAAELPLYYDLAVLTRGFIEFETIAIENLAA